MFIVNFYYCLLLKQKYYFLLKNVTNLNFWMVVYVNNQWKNKPKSTYSNTHLRETKSKMNVRFEKSCRVFPDIVFNLMQWDSYSLSVV